MPKILPALIAAAFLAAPGAHAQEAASAAPEVTETFTWSGVDVVPTMPMGEGQEAYLTESLLVISSTGGPLAGLAGRCLVAGVTDLTTMGASESGTCVYQDANGDQLWESIEGASEGNGAPFLGKATWTGGTGRFEGASGEMDYDAAFSASPRAGVYQGTGTKTGNLTLPTN